VLDLETEAVSDLLFKSTTKKFSNIVSHTTSGCAEDTHHTRWATENVSPCAECPSISNGGRMKEREVLHSSQLPFYFANFSYKTIVIKKKWYKVP
jgi:hypothetical protein